MKHSVILANYNGAEYLREAIASVLDQRDVEFEVFLIDDASTDESLRIMDESANANSSKVQVFQHDRNRGQGAGFNTGFKNSSGGLISFIDSDDRWDIDKLKIAEEAFQRQPDASTFQHALRVEANRQLSSEIIGDPIAIGDVFKSWVEKGITPDPVPTSGHTYPRAILEKILPMPDMRICADAFVFYAAIAFGPIIGDFCPHGTYRIHDANNYRDNDKFDYSQFFKAEILPPLSQLYACKGLPNPFAPRPKTLRDRVLNTSLRSLLRSFRSR